MAHIPGGTTVSLNTAYAYYADKGVDAIDLAMEYIQAWHDAVEYGEMTSVAGMKCHLADGPCGCPEYQFVTNFKCPGPSMPVAFEIMKDVLLAGLVEGVEAKYAWGPSVHSTVGHLYSDEFVHPEHPVLYVEKLF